MYYVVKNVQNGKIHVAENGFVMYNDLCDSFYVI